MCGPAALIGMTLAGAAIKGVGALVQGNANRQSYLASAAQQTRQAEQERLRGLYEMAQYKRQQSQLFSTTRSVAAASGVGLSGSVVEVLVDSAEQTEIDLAAIKYGADISASNFLAQAGADRANARRAMIGGIFGAVGQVASGVGSAISLMPANRSVIPSGFAP